MGLGPHDWDLTPEGTKAKLLDPNRTIIARSDLIPAAITLGKQRDDITGCDDLYEEGDTYPELYQKIAERVIETSQKQEGVIYAVPGSPKVGELAVKLIKEQASEKNLKVVVTDAQSFLDLLWEKTGIDPLENGFRILDATSLPNPILINEPTVITSIFHPMVFVNVQMIIDRACGSDSEIWIAHNLGGEDENLQRIYLGSAFDADMGPHTSVLVVPTPGGLVGSFEAMIRLRNECPWDRMQTHHSLLEHLIEEVAELAEAISALPEETPETSVKDDEGRMKHDPELAGLYRAVEEELGDVLLQVLFHSQIAALKGHFNIEDVGQVLYLKLVRRHPHVFGETQAMNVAQVMANWGKIKAEEEGKKKPKSLMDEVPNTLPAIGKAIKVQRKAASVGFDWKHAPAVIAKLREELDELEGASVDDPKQLRHEVGDLLFTIINYARLAEIEPEGALRSAVQRFVWRFRKMEEYGLADDMSDEQMELLWQRAKAEPYVFPEVPEAPPKQG